MNNNIISNFDNIFLFIIFSIIKGKPEPVISWSYKKIHSSTEFEDLVTESDNALHFKEVEIEHSGVYRCIAKNDLAYDKFEIEVVVECMYLRRL